MVHRIKPTPKQSRRLSKQSASNLLPIPKRWEDFARLCNIRSGNKIVKFDPYPYQIELSNCIDQNYATIVCKTRQLGITETIANKFLHKAALNPAYTAVVLSKGQNDTSNIAKRIRQMAESIPEYIQLETENLTDLRLINGGRIIFRSSSPHGTRGLESISDILFDEWAFVDNPDLIYTATVPATEMVGDAARLIMLSTPNGKSGFYFDRLTSDNEGIDFIRVCDDIRSGKLDPCYHWIDKSGWCKYIVHWLAHPIYSEIPDYLQVVRDRKKLPESTLQQEYNLSFEDSEVNVFSTELIQSCISHTIPEFQAWGDYYIGIDTATTGEDYFAAIVGEWEDSRLKVVEIYRKRKATSDYHLAKIGELLEKYQPQKVGIEITGGVGSVYLEQLSKRYPQFAFDAIRTTGDSKPAMINRLIVAMESKSIEYPLGILSDELSTFRRDGKRLEASKGYHDDCLMSLCFCLEVCPFSLERATGYGFNL